MSAADLEAARRVDWRFLLPDGELRDVLYVGPVDGSLPRALERCAGSVVRPGSGEACDVAVLVGGEREELAAAAAFLRPGGWLYWEGTGRTAPARAAMLARLGFEAVQVHWHWPSFDDCREIVPLDDPAAVRLAFARRRHGVRSRVKAGVAGVLQHARLLGTVLPAASVLGRRA